MLINIYFGKFVTIFKEPCFLSVLGLKERKINFCRKVDGYISLCGMLKLKNNRKNHLVPILTTKGLFKIILRVFLVTFCHGKSFHHLTKTGITSM